MESSDHRRASVPVITRKQLASSSSCDFLDQRYTAPAEDYIGRALPRYLSGFFSVSAQMLCDYLEEQNLSVLKLPNFLLFLESLVR